jgi:hypothetical protein
MGGATIGGSIIRCFEWIDGDSNTLGALDKSKILPHFSQQHLAFPGGTELIAKQ